MASFRLIGCDNLLDPARLNSCQIGQAVIFAADHPAARAVFADAFAPQGTEALKTIAVLTDQRDVRQMVQHSQFTVHGNATPVNGDCRLAGCWSRILIPANRKQTFRELADLLGANRSALFPDLANLAADLRTRAFHPTT